MTAFHSLKMMPPALPAAKSMPHSIMAKILRAPGQVPQYPGIQQQYLLNQSLFF